ncbi:DegT/DnrJ/EryC1/StrS family aminotransferase [bacterium]|nr:DegT/DnrJ/EryC1/StrS family aminotransferase [bacterium]
MSVDAVETMISVPYVDLGADPSSELARELLASVQEILTSGQFILGAAVDEFERQFAEVCGVKHAIGVGNGTEAIILTLRGLGIGAGDEVITAANSFLASASAIVMAGATPVFADVRDDLNLDPAAVEAVITERTKAILPVHLTGRPAEMGALLEIAERHGLRVIEDAAQAVGAASNGLPVGSFGAAGCFSLHPLKNLAAAGDGGVITTNDDRLADWLRQARNHGLRDRNTCDFWSVNSRLDALQAAMLTVKLRCLDKWTVARRANAAYYRERLADVVTVPIEKPEEYSVYHTFVIQAERRDELQRFLAERRIGSAVHYPIPIHLQPAAMDLGYRLGSLPVTERLAGQILSLPVHPKLNEEQLAHVVRAIRDFYGA